MPLTALATAISAIGIHRKSDAVPVVAIPRMASSFSCHAPPDAGGPTEFGFFARLAAVRRITPRDRIFEAARQQDPQERDRQKWRRHG
jgi:hypothetical protein